MDWDVEEITRDIKLQISEAERKIYETKSKIPKARDIYLAKKIVSEKCIGHFDTRDEFLTRLKELKKQINIPHNVYDRKFFEESWNSKIDSLIKKYSKQRSRKKRGA